MNPDKDKEKKQEWTIGDIIEKMGSQSYPEFIPQVVKEVQEWMNRSLSEYANGSDGDFFYSFADEMAYADTEKLVKNLDWLEGYADMIPGTRQPEGFEDAVVLTLGPSEFEDGIRVAIDHTAIFARGVCRRIWILCDSWMIGDVIRYTEHFKVLALQGVTFHFILISPWGWTEIPIKNGTREHLEQIDWKRNSKKGNKGTSHSKKEEDGFQS